MRLPKLSAKAPLGASRRRRRAPRPDGPRTILPEVPSAAASPAGPFDARLDAARARLRAAIPPPADED
ncbi:MAG: hypothetical protein HZB46_18390 [Solirubrobacterales bacterium]|nr:hypothetical protein [Solirubrobacterales bacterium]